MGVKVLITNYVLCLTLVLVMNPPSGVHGEVCKSTSLFQPITICEDNHFCCGIDNNECCSQLIPNSSQEVVAMFIILMAFTCCCVCCYRCCCRRTTSRGFVYSTPGTTTAVSVTLPPQHSLPTQQMPYPTVVPYPQQTPYPPQYNPPTNPYYGMPPPAYGVAVQSGNQQASAPSAPYLSS